MASYVLSLFEPCATLYQQALSTGVSERANNSGVQRTLAQCEGELAWLVYIIATVLGSHLTPNSNSETQQLVDGDLTCAVLQLLPLLDSPEYVRERSGQSSNVQLDLALLFFLQQFRKVWLGVGRGVGRGVASTLTPSLTLALMPTRSTSEIRPPRRPRCTRDCTRS